MYIAVQALELILQDTDSDLSDISYRDSVDEDYVPIIATDEVSEDANHVSEADEDEPLLEHCTKTKQRYYQRCSLPDRGQKHLCLVLQKM